MQKLFENWRNFRNEVLNEAGHTTQAKKEMQDRIRDSQSGRGFTPTPTGTPWPTGPPTAGDPDRPDDNSPDLEAVARELEIRRIIDAIEASGFNHTDIKHRMSAKRPWIEYKFDDNSGVWTYKAFFPDGSQNANTWPSIESEEAQGLESFLARVEKGPEEPSQLKFGL